MQAHTLISRPTLTRTFLCIGGPLDGEFYDPGPGLCDRFRYAAEPDKPIPLHIAAAVAPSVEPFAIKVIEYRRRVFRRQTRHRVSCWVVEDMSPEAAAARLSHLIAERVDLPRSA